MKKNIWASVIGLLIISSTLVFIQVSNKKDYMLNVIDIFNKKDTKEIDIPTPINLPAQEIIYNQVKTDNEVQSLKARISALEIERKKQIQLAFLNSEDGCKNTASTTFQIIKIPKETTNVKRDYTSHWNTKLKSCVMEVTTIWIDSLDSNHITEKVIYYNATKNKELGNCFEEAYINPPKMISDPALGCYDSIFLLFTEGLMTN